MEKKFNGKSLFFAVVTILAIMGLAGLANHLLGTTKNTALIIYWWSGVVCLLFVWLEVMAWANYNWGRVFMFAVALLVLALLASVAFARAGMLGPTLTHLSRQAIWTIAVIVIFGVLSAIATRVPDSEIRGKY